MKFSMALTLLGATFALAAPTQTTEDHKPSRPQHHGSEHLPGWNPFKGKGPGHYPGEPAPPGQSVSREPWKRHVPAVEERGEENHKEPGGYDPPKPYQSVSWVPWKRNVEETVPEPEHFEVLTA